MTANPQPSSPDRTPQWIIALSLLTIAICLVALVLRSFTEREPETAVTVESPTRETPTRDRLVRIVNPARAASAPAETSNPGLAELVVESATQTVVQTSQTIVITPPLWGRALGAKKEVEPDPASGQGLVGTVIGQVTLQGEPPPEKKFDVPASAGCDHLREHPPTTHSYVVGTNRGLANVFIRLVPTPSPGPSHAAGTNSRALGLTFTNCDLQPYLIALAPTDRLVLRNADPIKHVLQFSLREGMAPFATVPLDAGAEFNLESRALPRSEMQLLPVRCALHEWEQSGIAISKQPRFAITDASGRFAISNVPPYAYRVELYHPPTLAISSPLTRNITLFSGGTEAVSFRIHPKH